MRLPSPFRILLAEDNEVNRRVAIGMVERLGCDVEAVWNGRDALEILDYDRHDLILMDVQMPEMDGFAATAAIRDRERGTGRHIPIVAMTAHAMHGDRERCLAAGMDSYMSKPILPGPLREALLAWGVKLERASEVDRAADGPGRLRESRPPSFLAATLLESCGEDPKLTCEVLDLILATMSARLERLDAAIMSGDGGGVSWEAHGLKGSFATVGAEALAAGCQGLVSLGEGMDLAEIGKAYRLFRNQCEDFKEDASCYLATLRP